jgi:hypothetical protein
MVEEESERQQEEANPYMELMAGQTKLHQGSRGVVE